MAKKTDNTSNFYQVLNDISSIIDPGKDLMPDQYISEFQVNAREVCNQLEEVLDTSRTLKLGIVGEVKAGKSSFLNALLFEGEDILPKAPTPMTAALTRLSYSEKPEAKVYFYNRNDWTAICSNAKRYDELLELEYKKYCVEYDKKLSRLNSQQHNAGIAPSNHQNNRSGARTQSGLNVPKKKTKEEFEKEKSSIFPKEAVACKEVYEMAAGLNVDNYLSDEPVVISSEGGQDYMSQLHQYVGSNGRFTPIVKYTEIQLNNPLLKDIEVVDTPGLNDPIVSRSRTTSKFLMQCDAVFLLSYSGQFLGAEDIGFITSILPSEGINYAVIVGSKFDSGILDFPERNSTFRKARDQSRINFQNHARNNLNDYCKSSGSSTGLLQMLINSDIQFVSSLMYSAAKHIENNEPLSIEEKHIIDRFKERFSDFKPDASELKTLANIDSVRDTSFRTVKSSKEKILAERQEGILQSQTGKFLSYLEDLAIQAEANYAELKSTDVEALEEKINTMTHNLTSVRTQVKGLFDSAVSSVMSSRNGIMLEVSKELSNHTDIIVNTSTEQKRHKQTRTKGVLFWKKTEVVGYDVENITHHTANISDLQQNINSFNNRAMEIVNNRFKSMIKLDELRAQIKSVVMNAFDVGDRSFDENTVLLPLQSALNRIIVPTLNFDTEKYNEMIDMKLSGKTSGGTVRDDNIGYMTVAQQEILLAMQKDFTENIAEQCDNTASLLQKQSSVFIDSIVNELQENTNKLMKLLSDKKSGLAKFEDFISDIKKCKAMLLKLGKQ